jgi:hypothetical protein
MGPLGKVTGKRLVAVAIGAGFSFVGLPFIGIPIALVIIWSDY